MKVPAAIKKMGIGSRITIAYSILIAATLSISGIFYQKLYSDIMLNKVSSVSMQTLYSVSSNVRTLLETVNSYSKMTLANPSVQRALKLGQGYEDLENQRRIVEFMETVMSSGPEVDSLYIVDHHGNRFFMDTIPNHFQYFNPDQNSLWWKRAREMQGGSFVVLNGGDAFSRKSRKNFISMIRTINNLDNQKPIGAVLINISEDMFIKAYSEIAKNYETEITILDENNQIVIASNPNLYLSALDLAARAGVQQNYSELSKATKTLYSCVTMDDYNWKIISMIPYGEVKRESRIFILITFGSILMIAMLLMFGSVIITRMVTRPVNLLVDTMKDITKGHLEEVRFETSINEFIRLRDGYNLMIDEIHTLLEKIVREEKFKRKAEMNFLQEQIKPHFLYNTFDSVSSLALMGRNDDVYKMMSALGSFYRISLSKGKEVITISEELETVRSYLAVLKYRYPDLFTAGFNPEPETLSREIPKLVLQPFVENAVYHGLKPRNEEGRIEIRTWREDERVKLLIEDDGIGMSEEKLEAVLSRNAPSKSFGIWGTVQRLRLYYGEEDIVSIESRRGEGTRVLISIPAEGDG